MNKQTLLFVSLAIALMTVFSPHSLAQRGGRRRAPSWEGARTAPMHRATLFNERGRRILPDDILPMPLSTRRTCGRCHNYDTVRQGLHFNSSSADAPAGRPGEPWVWVDEATGAQLPLSFRDWPGLYQPEQVGVTPWEFTLRFGRHLPGGDMSEPDDQTLQEHRGRWPVSGKLEIHCLGCHNRSPMQSQGEWAAQTARENFRWAATAAAGMAAVNGNASSLPESWTMYDDLDFDNASPAAPPSVEYDPSMFSPRGRAMFDLSRKVPDTRCLSCHATGKTEVERWRAVEDVHAAVGIGCTDCHRNGLDHRMVRGYADEATERDDPQLAEFSCRGCHLGEDSDGQPVTHAGRLGAPRPLHPGLPVNHLNNMTCTACHSGQNMTDAFSETGAPRRILGARINSVGLHGQARRRTERPYITEPVFARGADGRLAPHRALWPAFWARVQGEQATPLNPDQVAVVAPDIFAPEQQLTAILAALGEAAAGEQELDPWTPVMIAEGKLYRRGENGRLQTEDYLDEPAVATATWMRRYDGWLAPLAPELTVDADGYLETAAENSLVGLLRALALLRPAAPGEKPSALPTFRAGDQLFRLEWIELLQEAPLSEEADAAFRAGVEPGAPLWGRLRDQVVKAFDPELFTPPELPSDQRSQLTDEAHETIKHSLQEIADRQPVRGDPVLLLDGGMFSLEWAETLVAEDWTGDAEAPVWGWQRGERLQPLAPELVWRTAQVTLEGDQTLTEELVALGLKALDEAPEFRGELAPDEYFAYLAGGMLFRLSDDGQLTAEEHPAAEPYLWPLGHNVRPAAQSLGSKGCTECHHEDAAFYYGEVRATSPLATTQLKTMLMHEFQGPNALASVHYRKTIRVAFFWLTVISLSLLAVYLLGDLRRRMRRRSARAAG